MTTITMQAPIGSGLGGTITGMKSGVIYQVNSLGQVSAQLQDVQGLTELGFSPVLTFVGRATFLAPLPADLVSIVNAVTPTNVALTIAAQPPQARKLQVRVVIGTTTTTAITAGNLALVGVDQDGNAVSENISLIANASTTLKSANCYASLTSPTVSAYAANGSGTGNTVGIGVSNDFGVQTGPGVANLALIKSTKIITTVTGSVTAWARAVTDDVASTATIDTVARTVAPTTAPGSAGINDYEFTYSYQLRA